MQRPEESRPDKSGGRRHDQPRDRFNKRDQKDGRDDGEGRRLHGSRPPRNGQERRDGGERGGERRGDRRGPSGADKPPRVFSAGDKRDKREPDPDSPFAKLLALKAKLEGKE
jgi:ATP-dependent RNA helicase SUPV3L1/SUV3